MEINFHRSIASGGERTIEKMKRFDLYLKVVLDLDEKENPDRLAAEICRQIRKVYGVREAEVSNTVPRE